MMDKLQMARAKKAGGTDAEKAFKVRDIENVSPVILQLLVQFSDEYFGRTFYGKRKFKVKRISHHQWRSELRNKNCSVTIEKVFWGDYLCIDLKIGPHETRSFSLPFTGEQHFMEFGYHLTSELEKVYEVWRNQKIRPDHPRKALG